MSVLDWPCEKCKFGVHEIDCPDFVSINEKVEAVLRKIKTNNRYKREDLKFSFSNKKDIVVYGDGKTFLHGFCSVHWEELPTFEDEVRFITFKNVLEDDEDKNEWGDVACRKWFKNKYGFRFAVYTPKSMDMLGIKM
jgi:hypothetical protein